MISKEKLLDILGDALTGCQIIGDEQNENILFRYIERVFELNVDTLEVTAEMGGKTSEIVANLVTKIIHNQVEKTIKPNAGKEPNTIIMVGGRGIKEYTTKFIPQIGSEILVNEILYEVSGIRHNYDTNTIIIFTQS